MSIDREGKNYCGLEINWNYNKKYVDISMSNYIPKVLQKHQHPHPDQPNYAPFPWSAPTFGQRMQYTKKTGTAPLLDEKGKKTSPIRH